MQGISIPALFGLVTLIGVVLLGRQLATIYQAPALAAAESTRLPPALAGERFSVSPEAGFQRITLNGGTLLTEGPQRTLGQVSVSLCDQRARPNDPNSPLIPLYIGWDWTRIRELVDANLASVPPRPAASGLKNPLLDDGPGGVDVPAVVLDTQPPGAALSTLAMSEGRLRLTLRDSRPLAGLSDMMPDLSSSSPPVLNFHQDAWLFWDAGNAPGRWRQALRVQRLHRSDCAFGAVQVTLYGPPDETVPAQASRRLRFYSRQGSVATFQLYPGDYAVSAETPSTQEDADLFVAATTTGLIHLDADGRIALAPADLPRRERFSHDHPERLVAETADPWLALPWDDAIQAVHRQLYGAASGRYVRQQIDAFNARRWLAALRVRVEDNAIAIGPWQAEQQGVHLPLTSAMPLLASGLFAELPLGWEPWQRVERWPSEANATTPVRLTAPLGPHPNKQPLHLLAVGSDIHVEGAALLSDEPRCLSGSSCQGMAVLAHELRVQAPANATRLTIVLQPLSAQAAPALFQHDFAHIHLDNGQLHWQALTLAARRQRGEQRAQVTLRDRNGALLWEPTGPTETSWALGLGVLVGLHPQHAAAIAGVLARLGEQGIDSVDARLTLDSKLQQLARTALLEQLPAVSARFGALDLYRAQRFASLVVLDADQGDILAAVSLPEPPRDAAWADLYRFAAAQPRHGPLSWWAWQHDGGILHVPGSTFKLISALALERAAQDRAELDALLNGLEPEAIARHPLASHYDFGVLDACYPAHDLHCQYSRYEPAQQRDSGGAIHNFATGGRYETLANQAGTGRDRRYGLTQALRDSLNTWFAWLVEATDATLLDEPQATGLAHARALTPAALNRVRPLAAVTTALGFGTVLRLDSSLLPAGVLRPGDVLLTTPPSQLDPIEFRHQVRLAALGFRMQVTPLQMARVAASIATQKYILPRLVLELNGRTAAKPDFAALGISTQRIRKGMKRVPEDGTAQQAFKDRRFDVLRPALYAKTGTADLPLPGDVNNAWLVGWVEPGGIPGEARRLAFACLISHTRDVGGRECGSVVANFLAALTEAGKAQRRKE